MKKTIIVCIVAMLFAAACSSTQTQATAAPPDELDVAIREASDYLNNNIPKGAKVVFLNIKSDYPDLSEYILNDLSKNAVNDKVFAVVDRAELDTIRAELNFQLSGEVSDESAQSIGHMLGAQSIVSGTVGKIGSLYRLDIKAIEVQTAQVQGQWNRNIPNGATITALAENVAAANGAAAASTGGKVSNTTQPVKTYKIGDTGPAGGIVFYDKGNNQGGWRYLEAAPADSGNAVYSTEELTMLEMDAFNDDNGRGIGKGKYNTERIMELAGQKGGGFGWAAQLCDAYEHNGFDDWFLPSRDELNYMYGNLYTRGAGAFRPENYWSSTGHWNTYQAWYQNFSGGEQDTAYITSNQYRVRACRQF